MVRISILTTGTLYDAGGPVISCSSGAPVAVERSAVRPCVRDLPGKGDDQARERHHAVDRDFTSDVSEAAAVAARPLAAFAAEIRAAWIA